MNLARPHSSSPYIEFAKLSSGARFNLATSGVANYPLCRLQARMEDLEISGPAQYGYDPLEERIARFTGIPAGQVVSVAGTSMANHLAMSALFQPGDEVLIEEPTYEPIVSTALFLGAKVMRFQRRPDDGYQVDCGHLARSMSGKTRLIVLTNLHNPSSALLGEDALRQIGEIARARGAYVLVDEVYLEALFDRRPPSAAHHGEHFVVTSSLTKAYGLSGLRCGWILAEPGLARQIWRLNDLFGVVPVHVAELLAVAAFDRLDTIGRRAQEIIESNRRAAREILDGIEQIELTLPAAGTTLFPKLKRGAVEDFSRVLREEFETSVVPGRFFERPQHFRVGLGGEIAMTREALIRLAAALKKWEG